MKPEEAYDSLRDQPRHNSERTHDGPHDDRREAFHLFWHFLGTDENRRRFIQELKSYDAFTIRDIAEAYRKSRIRASLSPAPEREEPPAIISAAQIDAIKPVPVKAASRKGRSFEFVWWLLGSKQREAFELAMDDVRRDLKEMEEAGRSPKLIKVVRILRCTLEFLSVVWAKVRCIAEPLWRIFSLFN
jgi:hypothetical protein